MATFRKLPSGKFFAEVRRKGLPNISRAFPNDRAAKAWARRIESEIDRGVFQRKLEQAQLPSVLELLDRYEKEITQGKKGRRQERYRLQQFRDPSFAPFTNKPVTEVTEGDIVAWRHRRLGEVSADTVRREMVILGAFFNQCGNGAKSRSGGLKRPGWRLIKENPVEIAGKPTGGSRRRRRVSEREIDAVCGAAESADLAAFIRLAAETAMRRGEIARIVRADVVFEGGLGYIKLHEGETKNDAPRAVPLTTAAAGIVRTLVKGKQESDRLFTLKPDSYTQAFIRARNRARALYEQQCHACGEVPDAKFLMDLRLHDHRHEGTSRLFEVHNLGVIEAAEITGHKDPRMLKSYAHQEPLKLARTLSKSSAARYAAVARKTRNGYKVLIPDLPGASLHVKALEQAHSVASALVSACPCRPLPTSIEEVKRRHPGCDVFFVG